MGTIKDFAQRASAHPFLLWVNTIEEYRFIQEIMEFVVGFSHTQDVENKKYANFIDPDLGMYIWTMTNGGVTKVPAAFEDISDLNEYRFYREGISVPTAKSTQANPFIASSKHWALRRPIPDTASLPELFQFIITQELDEIQTASLFILPRIHQIVENPVNISLFRDMFNYLNLPVGTGKLIIGISDGTPPPPELEKIFTQFSFDLPSYETIRQSLYRLCRSQIRKKLMDKDLVTSERLDEAAHILRGLTWSEYKDITGYCNATVRDILDTPTILAEKRRILKQDPTLEIVETTFGLEAVGGMDRMKDQLATVHNTMNKNARDYGVEPSKGCIVVGPPGTAKTTMGKALCYDWGLTLIKFDLGRLMSSLVGSTEARMRAALQRIEAQAPCGVLIDEIEKMFAGVTDERSGDSGTTKRAFGYFLSWMEDRFDNKNLADIFVYAASNNITLLPSELIRRFDNVWCTDLPVETERRSIFEIHISSKPQGELVLKDIDLNDLAAYNYEDDRREYILIGDEIKRAVNAAWRNVYNENTRKYGIDKRPRWRLPQQHDFMHSLQQIVPLHCREYDKIEKIRREARKVAEPVSSFSDSAAQEVPWVDVS